MGTVQPTPKDVEEELVIDTQKEKIAVIENVEEPSS